ncbi:MAG: alpha/beta hydrolase [Pirellulaceae bacterium]|nr:alpha/beta hydrolase [Pirellulaceae bacterium]
MNIHLLYRMTAIGLIASLSLLSTAAIAQVPGPIGGDRAAEIESNMIQISVPTVNGRVVWKDVATSLGRSLTLDPASLERMLPKGSLDLRDPAMALALMGIDLALGDAMSIELSNNIRGEPTLHFRCNRRALRRLAPDAAPARIATIEIDKDWQQRTRDRPLVVCLHGLKSEPAKFDAFRRFLRDNDLATAAVNYDDRQSIVDSAAQAAAATRQVFAGADPPEMVLVGYSMGGLVAREWLENPQLRNPAIVSLVTVGTPHRGSNWATLPPLLDLIADDQIDISDVADIILHQPSSAGLRDLSPQSDCLARMDSRPRVPGVQYTTIVGTGSPVTDADVQQLRETLQRLETKSSVVQLIRPRIQPLLESFDELARGKGDGVVAAERATISGVADVVSVDLSHIELFSPSWGNQPQPVWQAILERAKK